MKSIQDLWEERPPNKKRMRKARRRLKIRQWIYRLTGIDIK